MLLPDNVTSVRSYRLISSPQRQRTGGAQEDWEKERKGAGAKAFRMDEGAGTPSEQDPVPLSSHHAKAA